MKQVLFVLIFAQTAFAQKTSLILQSVSAAETTIEAAKTDIWFGWQTSASFRNQNPRGFFNEYGFSAESKGNDSDRSIGTRGFFNVGYSAKGGTGENLSFAVGPSFYAPFFAKGNLYYDPVSFGLRLAGEIEVSGVTLCLQGVVGSKVRQTYFGIGRRF